MSAPRAPLPPPPASPDLPQVVTAVPGPRSRALVDDLALSECPAITARRARRSEATGATEDPVVWERARGALVWDVDGNRYVDLTSAFGVATVGHAHPAVVAAGQAQLAGLPHGMGDVFPNRRKVELAVRLGRIAPPGLDRVIFATSGSDAVDAALKTALIATGRPETIVFSGGYHGLSLGALGATSYRREFRAPFLPLLSSRFHHVPFPDPLRPPRGVDSSRVGEVVLGLVEALLADPASGACAVGSILVEPILGRGGIVVPPRGFLPGLRALCDRYGILLVLDEILTGFGRTGDWFACSGEGVVPDLMCVGKGMSSAFPISACLGTAGVMERWGRSSGEAIHTSTFQGNPVGAAMALAAIDALEGGLLEQGRRVGAVLRALLDEVAARHPHRVAEVRGRGLMLGVDLVRDREDLVPDGASGLRASRFLLERGFLCMPAGAAGHVLAVEPPACLTGAQAAAFATALDEFLSR